jgi:Fe2+ or Zn2+ uptake regulation protein
MDIRRKKRGSIQRDRLLEILKSTDAHPTADWLYQQMKREFPNLSLGTVYRNLKILAEASMIKELRFGSTYDRFDGNFKTHYHFICRRCNKVFDMDMPVDGSLVSKAKEATISDIEGHEVSFYGICNLCKET